MTGVVDNRRSNFAGSVGHAANDHGIVRGDFRIVATNETLTITQVAIRGERAPPGMPLQCRRLRSSQGPPRRLHNSGINLFGVRWHKVAALPLRFRLAQWRSGV